jgi:hypothetical protein
VAAADAAYATLAADDNDRGPVAALLRATITNDAYMMQQYTASLRHSGSKNSVCCADAVGQC